MMIKQLPFVGNVIQLLEAGACYVILLPLQMFGRARHDE
jgi:hypothetical protein